MKIFEIIKSASSRIEPYHSRFLAAALEESSVGDRSLFKAVWALVAPSEWEAPNRPEILSEFNVGTGPIDIVIRSRDQRVRILGIEVKTNEGSTTEGQLGRYRDGLKVECPEADLAIAYLTPFNRERAAECGVETGESLPTVREFKEFSGTFSRARHVSWLDVADIPWASNTLWEQHREYVREHISNCALLKEPRKRALDHFFGPEPTQRFREALASLRIRVGGPGEDINIDLNEFRIDGLSSIAEGLVKALQTLVCEGEGVRDPRNPRKDAFEYRHEYLKSSLGLVHAALFLLADKNPNMWLEGKKDYGVRVAHDKYENGVSLIRSIGHCALRITGQR